jgi:outer membrane protein OmpA-like peptidoglycan-associated protein
VITVVAKLNATGIKDAAGSGGAAITVMASITPASGAKLSATTTLTVTKKTTTITLVSDILFGSGSATLKPAGVKALRKIAQQLRGAKQITCVGHTDADGSAAANQALGLARAKAVCALLKLPGSKTRFITKSKGATQPVAPNTTPANKAKNRRVEIKIVNG